MERDKTLAHYCIENDHVIHLVCKTEQSSQISLTVQPTSHEPEIIHNLIEIPSVRNNFRRRIRTQNFEIAESFEAIHQNLSTLSNLSKCKKKFNKNEFRELNTIVPFDLSKSSYSVGQWVDVVDTIDQWLDAQVVDVKDDKAYIHYNGWGTRWDEWIHFSSPRIAPFKTYCTQSLASVYNSPYPEVPVDANIEPQERCIDSLFYLHRSGRILKEISEQIDYIADLQVRSKERDNEITKNKKRTKKLNTYDNEILHNLGQLIPFLDRTGRLMSDLALQFSHLLPNATLYPNLVLGKNNKAFQNEDEEIISVEEKVVKKEKKLESMSEKYKVSNEMDDLEKMLLEVDEKKNEHKSSMGFKKGSVTNDSITEDKHNRGREKDESVTNLEDKLFKVIEESSITANEEKTIRVTEGSVNDEKLSLKEEFLENIKNIEEQQLEHLKGKSEKSNENKTVRTVSKENDVDIKKIENELNEKENYSVKDSEDSEESDNHFFHIEEPDNLRVGQRLLSESNSRTVQTLVDRFTSRLGINRNRQQTVDPNQNRNPRVTVSTFYPKVKIQIPALFTPGEINSLQGGPLAEPAFDLVIHTIVNTNAQNNTNITIPSEHPNNNQTLNSYGDNQVEEVALNNVTSSHQTTVVNQQGGDLVLENSNLETSLVTEQPSVEKKEEECEKEEYN